MYTKNKNRLADIEDKFVVNKGEMKGREGQIRGMGLTDIYILMYQMDKQYEYTLKHRECHYLVIRYILFLVAKLCPILCNHLDCKDCQAPPSMGFPRQEYWSESPFPLPGYISDRAFPAWKADFLPLNHQGSPW